ncbi:MAG: 50S ribosomal protein L21 [Patescibacteria group bacterium]
MKFAVIQTGGKQYKVKEGDKVRVEKLDGKAGDALKFNEVLLKAEGDKIEIGMPFVKGAAVETEVLGQVRDDKKIIFRYHSKTRYRKFKTHRQPFTELKIKEIK